MTSNISYGYYRNSTHAAFRLLLKKLEQGKNEDVIEALKYATSDSEEQNKSMGRKVIEKLNKKNAN